MKPKIAVLVVAYNAQDTLKAVLDRIPESFIPEISTVLVCDDRDRERGAHHVFIDDRSRFVRARIVTHQHR